MKNNSYFTVLLSAVSFAQDTHIQCGKIIDTKMVKF
jgi:hypothetical protein